MTNDGRDLPPLRSGFPGRSRTALSSGGSSQGVLKRLLLPPPSPRPRAPPAPLPRWPDPLQGQLLPPLRCGQGQASKGSSSTSCRSGYCRACVLFPAHRMMMGCVLLPRHTPYCSFVEPHTYSCTVGPLRKIATMKTENETRERWSESGTLPRQAGLAPDVKYLCCKARLYFKLWFWFQDRAGG